MDEVIEYAEAFMQLYREQARYLERTAPWIERVGLSYVKERIVDDAEGRKQLAERFITSQKYSQNDPWKQYAEADNKEELIPLKQFEQSKITTVVKSWTELKMEH